MSRPYPAVRTASSSFLTWLLLPTLLGYFFSGPADKVVMPPVGAGCPSVAPVATLPELTTEELAADFVVTGVCCTSFSFTGMATGSSPTLTLTRGVTYTFTLTTGAAHPFTIRPSSLGTNIAGPFTTDFTFTPDFVMPSNMVYQCAIHSPMLGNIVLVSPNSPPNATNLSAPETFTEEVALNLTDISVSDADNTTTTATLTLSTPSAGSLSTATSGSVTSTYNTGTGVWTASGAIANVNTLLSGLTYTPTANFASNFTIATSVSDAIAAPVTGTKNMTAVPVNDAPVLGSAALAAVLEDAASPAGQSVATIFTGQFTDVDAGSSFAGIAVLGNTATAGSQGVWQYSTNAGTTWANIGTVNPVAALAVSAASLVRFLPVANFNGAPAALSVRGLDNTYAGAFSATAGSESRVTVSTATSGGTTAIASAVASLSTTITAVNDPPQATNLNAAESCTEDVNQNLIDIVASDVDNANVTATLTLSNTGAGSLSTATSGAVTSTFSAGVWTATGATANVNTLLSGVTFIPALNFNSSLSITTSVSDGALAVNGSKAVTITAVNDAPTATNLNAAESYTEDASLSLIDIVAGDVDNATLTATLTLSNTVVGSITTATSGAVTSTYNAGTGVWAASGATSDVNTLLAGADFVPSPNSNGSFFITTGVSDGALAVTGSKPVTGNAVNDAPNATNLNASESYTPGTPLDLTDIVVSDVDNTSLSATFTLSTTAAGSLSTATSGAVTSTYNAGTGVWNASGAIADLNTLLAGVNYVPAVGFSSSFTIASSVSDGLAAALTGSKAMTASVTSVAVAARAFLEAGYDPATGTMNDALRSAGVLPNGEPYTALGYTHVGGGGEAASASVFTTSGSDAIVDWVVLELRDALTPSTVVASHAALLQRDGDVVGTDGASPVQFGTAPGSYYVAVRHRNHLGCMTASAVALSSSPVTVDFTGPATATFGTAARKSIPGAFPAQVLWSGDVTFNHAVQYTGSGNDRDPILVTVGSTTPNNVVSNTYSTRDVNMNANVQYTGSGNDRDPVLVNVGSTTPNNVRLEQLP